MLEDENYKEDIMMSFNPVVIDEHTMNFMKKASENAVKRLEVEHGVQCADWKGIPTIGIVWLEEVFRELGNEARNSGGEAKVNIHQIMSIGVNLRMEEDAEKDGNLTISIAAGPIPKQLIKNDALTEAEE